MNINELHARHPMPWIYVTTGGLVQILDKTGKEVPMFLMLDLVCAVTLSFVNAQPAAAQG